MKFDLARIGPRRCALFALVAGGVLTLPFLRRASPAPKTESLEAAATEAWSVGPVEGSSPPVTTEFPIWARKPSALDELITGGKSSTTDSNPPETSPSDEKLATSGQELTAQSVSESLPVPLAEKMSAPPPAQAVNSPQIAAVNRYSPFSDVQPIENQTSAVALAIIQWPDQKLAIPQDQLPQNQLARRDPSSAGTAGTDLFRRDVAQSVTGNEAGGFAQPGRPVGHSTGAALPRFGSPGRKEIGASLRSRIPPSDDLFIAQPSKHQ